VENEQMKLALDSQMLREGLLQDPDPAAARHDWLRQQRKAG